MNNETSMAYILNYILQITDYSLERLRWNFWLCSAPVMRDLQWKSSLWTDDVAMYNKNPDQFLQSCQFGEI